MKKYLATTSNSLIINDFQLNSQMFVDYDTRTDGQPVYVGYASRGVASSTASWTLFKLTYNASDYVTSRQVAYDSWDNRASATYA